MKKVLLIDGSAMMYKSFFASAFLLSKGEGLDSNGNPINALRTFSTIILNLIEMFPEHNMLVAFDEKNLSTFRTKYSFYKAGRSKMPDELIYQKPLIEEVLNLSGIEHYSSKNYEADDIIGILSNKFSNEKIKVDIITSDKDLLQLVDENINVHISKTGVSEMLTYTKDNFKELYYGLLPNQVIDMKAIMGDSSDNLPGIKGIGEKGAIKLLKEYGTFENVILNKDLFSESIKNKIIEGQETGKICKEIATIITKGNLNIEFDQLKVGPASRDDLINFFKGNSIYNICNRLEKKWL